MKSEQTHKGCVLHGSVRCVSSLDMTLASGGCPPWLQPSSEGLGLLPGIWGAPKKENVDGARSIFGTARRVWAMVLWLDPPKNRPYLYTGGEYDKYRANSERIQVTCIYNCSCFVMVYIYKQYNAKGVLCAIYLCVCVGLVWFLCLLAYQPLWVI